MALPFLCLPAAAPGQVSLLTSRSVQVASFWPVCHFDTCHFDTPLCSSLCGCLGVVKCHSVLKRGQLLDLRVLGCWFGGVVVGEMPISPMMRESDELGVFPGLLLVWGLP